MKILGAEFKQFCNEVDSFLGGECYFEISMMLGGVNVWENDIDPEDDKFYDVDGAICVRSYKESPYFCTIFRKWKKSKKTSIIVVEVPSDELEAIKTYLKEHKCKIIGR